MKCPCCRNELKPWKMLRLETLDEHVSCCQNITEKMAYVCLAPGCSVNAASPSVKMFWNENGDYYENFDVSTSESYKRDVSYFRNIPWVDGNNAPFGSLQRQINVEVYKTDENKILFVVPKWFLIRRGWKCEQVWHYKSNENGDILHRSWSLKWWKPNDHGFVLHISGWRMLRFELRSVFRSYVQILNGNEKWATQELNSLINRSKWENAEWWRHCGAFAARCVLGFYKIATS